MIRLFKYLMHKAHLRITKTERAHQKSVLTAIVLPSQRKVLKGKKAQQWCEKHLGREIH